MKKLFTFLVLALFTFSVNAQFVSETFEVGKADTAWNQFANAGDAPENMVMAANPDYFGINNSDSCLMFTILPEADPWVGAWADLGDIVFSDDNYYMYMMVFKEGISNCGLKVEAGGDPANLEVMVPNTVTDEWEVLEFDFAAAIGLTYTRLVFFPDFPTERTEGSTAYVDNIAWEDMTFVSVKRVNNTFISIFPNPATEMIQVQYPGMKSITISNIVGQQVRTLTSTSNYIEKVPVSDLKAGVYFVTLDTPDGLVSSKFVKQ
jgi:hypothetical protein